MAAMKDVALVFIDTNCLNEEGTDQDLTELERLEDKGIILMEKTDVIDTEMIEGNYQKGLFKSLKLIESFGPAVWGHSRWGHSVWSSQEDEQKLSSVVKCLFGEKPRSSYRKQQIRDAMNVITAGRYGGNYFCTYDRQILKKAIELRSLCGGVLVCTPKDCLAAISKKIEFLESLERQ